MLPKKNRLNKKEINELKSKKKNILQGVYFGLIFQSPTLDFGEQKTGVIISNNISKKATKRNKIKRLLFRAILKHPFKRKGKYLFLAKRTSLVAGLNEVAEEIIGFQKKYD